MAGDKRSFLSKEDLTGKISKTVFVTNFPDHITARDLWNVCTAYGKVVDVYIPLKRSQNRSCNWDTILKGNVLKILEAIVDLQGVTSVYDEVYKLLRRLSKNWIEMNMLQASAVCHSLSPDNRIRQADDKTRMRNLKVMPLEEIKKAVLESVALNKSPGRMPSLIVNMLKCFYLASGLKINIQKSKIMGIGTSQEEVDVAANVIGCNTFSSPFNYLDVKVGSSSSRSNFWDEVSVKGFLFMYRVSLNLDCDGGALTTWKVGNGLNTLFWVDSWLTDIPLKQLYPRMFALDCNKNSTVAEKINASSISCSFRRLPRGSLEEEQFSKLIEDVNSVILSVSNDRWIWSLDSSGEFSIKSTRLFIDDHSFSRRLVLPTRWFGSPQHKNNTCLERESCSHLFFSCSMAWNITTKLVRWWKFDCPDLFSYDDWLEWFHTLRLLKGFKDILEGVFYVMWWVIWKYRNQTLFDSSQPRMDMLFDEIVNSLLLCAPIGVKTILIGSLG
ncbi:RNA-directed DNA polymerase, eukaryota [Tanacetum coccineum]